jgi:hypothetical protein
VCGEFAISRRYRRLIQTSANFSHQYEAKSTFEAGVLRENFILTDFLDF